MSSRYIGGIVTKNPTALNPALGNAANGIFTMDQYVQQKTAGTWPAYDPNQKYTTLLLHGEGTNGGQNNTFLDSSTNNFTITRNGNTTQGSFSPYGSNWSNSFSSGNYLTTPSNAVFAFGTGDFTIEMWLYVNAYTSGAAHLIGPHTQNVGADWWLTVLDTGLLNFAVGNGSAGDPRSTSAVPLNTWTHIAVVKSSGVYAFYINGVASGTTSNSTSIGCTRTVGIGAPNNGSVYPFNGYISNLRVVKGTAVYTSAFTPSTIPLTAITNTSLLTCQSNRFIDNSSNALALTAVGSVSVQRSSPFAPTTAYSTATIGGSGYFDGSGDYLTGTAPNLSGTWTVEFWWYPTNGVTTQQTLVSFNNGSSTGINIWCNTSAQLVVDDGANAQSAFTSVTFKPNQWHHVAIVRNSTTTTGYINGVSAGSNSFTPGTTSAISVARYNGGSFYYTYGYLTDARVVNGTAVYTTTFTPPTSPLAAITNTSLLLSMQNGSIFDNAMMNDLETVGNAQVSTSVKKYGTGSLYFDGTGDYLIAAASQNFAYGTGNFTWEFWLYPTAASWTTGNFYMIDHGSGSNGGAVQYYQNILRYYNATTGTGSSLYTSGGTVAANTWTHIAIVRSGGTTTIYKNGVAATSASDSNNYGSQLLSVGSAGNGTQTLEGYIDDLRITKGYARYTANFTPPTSQLQDQ